MFGAVLVLEEGRPALPVSPDLLIAESITEQFGLPSVTVLQGQVGGRMRKSLVGSGALAGSTGEGYLDRLIASRIADGWRVKHYSTSNPDSDLVEFRFEYMVGRKRQHDRIAGLRKAMEELGESTGIVSVLPAGALSAEDKKYGGFAFAMAGKVHRVSGSMMDDLVFHVAAGSPEHLVLAVMTYRQKLLGLVPVMDGAGPGALEGILQMLPQQEQALRQWVARCGLGATELV